MSGPLEGLRIIDLTAIVSGPFATQILADQGADVIKVEAPGVGDLVRAIGYRRGTVSTTFASINRNKRSIVIDLKTPEGVALLMELVRTADAFLQNFRPGAVERLGIAYEDVRRVRPDIVYVSISGFGEKGPYVAKRVYDPVIQMLSGMVETQTNPATGKPDFVRNIVCDKVTSLTAAQAVTAALLARERGQGGQHVRLAMLDAAIAFLWPDGLVNETFVGDDVKRGLTMSDIYAVFEAVDGYMAVYISSNAEWQGFCRALGHPELIEDERFRSPNRRGKNFRAMYGEVHKLLAGMTVQEVCQLLDKAEVPCAPMLAREELRNDPQVIANELIVEQDFETLGRVRQPRPPTRFEGTPTAIRTPAPALGEHTTTLLRELGKSHEEIARLRSAGTIA